MLHPFHVVAVAVAFGFAAPAGAQPALQSMPMPPSANDPPPKETRSAPARKPARPAQAKRDDDGALAVPETARRRSGSSATVERPKRYVPAEFDRGGDGQGRRVEPFVSDTGRPGMGMKF